MTGKTVSHYKVIEKLGGGMGVVYKARDTRLDRLVALKFLPPYLSADEEANERFVREARAASSLDHTNICTVYDIGETEEGATFIAMAYCEGTTLRRKLERGPMPLALAVQIVAQIAEGLARAHDAGIVHRDVKPANIMVSERGDVKILDFGLAKLIGGMELTKADTTMGTVPYMSPEQVNDVRVDRRTDIWSLGIILYEMLTGERPFRGAYDQAVIYSIVNEKPEPAASLRPDIPESLARMIEKMLRKDPAERYQNVADILAELRPGRSSVIRSRRVAIPRRRALTSLGFAVPALIIVAYFFSDQDKGTDAVTTGRITQLTREPGLEIDPDISPDGKMLAYTAGTPGKMHLYVRQIDSERALRLTEGPTGDYRAPKWSPDGTRIAFQSEGLLFVMPALGGSPKRLVNSPEYLSRRDDPQAFRRHHRLSEIGVQMHSLAWSPDGEHLAFIIGSGIHTQKIGEDKPHELAEAFSPHSLCWSPDGTRLAYVSGNPLFLSTKEMGNSAPSAIWVVSVNDGKAVQVTDNDYLNMNPVWQPDPRCLLFISNRSGIRDVHRIALKSSAEPEGPPVRLTTGLNAFSMSLSHDGKYLVYSAFANAANIWSIAIPDGAPVSVSEAEPVTSGNQTIEGLGMSADGQWLAYDSNRSGNQDIYKMHLPDGEAEQLTTNTSSDFLPSWSPDGREIAFHSFRDGNRNIYVISADGGRVQQVTDDPQQEHCPDWSPDGEQLVYYGSRTGRYEIYTVARKPDGSGWDAPRQLTLSGGFEPRWSPDGRLIAYTWEADNSLRVISPEGGEPRVLVQSQDPAILPRPDFQDWSPDGQTIYYKAFDAEGRSSIWSIPAAGGTPQLLVKFDDPSRPSIRDEFTTDGRRFYFTLARYESDIWQMELLREK